MDRCYCPTMTDEEFLEWDMKELDWTGKTFYQVRVPMISHFPISPELKIPKVMEEIEQKGFQPVAPNLIIFNDGMLIGSLMVEIVKPSGRHANVYTLGKTHMLAKAFKGPKFLVPKALKEFDRQLMRKQIMTSDFYFRYLTCKTCNKNDKENKTIILAKIN